MTWRACSMAQRIQVPAVRRRASRAYRARYSDGRFQGQGQVLGEGGIGMGMADEDGGGGHRATPERCRIH